MLVSMECMQEERELYHTNLEKAAVARPIERHMTHKMPAFVHFLAFDQFMGFSGSSAVRVVCGYRQCQSCAFIARAVHAVPSRPTHVHPNRRE